MIICKNCGVELEPDIDFCPLCEGSVGNTVVTDRPVLKHDFSGADQKLHRKAIWELVSIIFILIIVVTSLLNYCLNKKISWSEYPVAICLISFSYVSGFVFLNKRRKFHIVVAFLTSSIFVLALDQLTGGLKWSLRLGIPLLLCINIIFGSLILIINSIKQKGINIIAYSMLASALFCILVEAILDSYIKGYMHLVWSLIVSACVFPVASVLLFVHFRMKKGNDLSKIFHV
jgi:hypothetical protein